MVTYYKVNRRGDRPYQEDSVDYILEQNEGVFAVADGLGGHGHGSEASAAVVRHAVDSYYRELEPDTYFTEVFYGGNSILNSLQDENQNQSAYKTTLVLAMLKEDRFYAAHIGDSRCYFFQDGRMISRTMDHSVPQMLVLTGDISEKQIRHHPDRNRVLRVLGTREDNPGYQAAEPFPATVGTSCLLCTDGFWELITENVMERYLRRARDVREWITLMTNYVRRKGRWSRNMDNYSAIGIWVR